MKRLKIFSVISLILSSISMIWGIGVLTYFVDDLLIRGISVGILVISSNFVASTVGLVFRELK